MAVYMEMGNVGWWKKVDPSQSLWDENIWKQFFFSANRIVGWKSKFKEMKKKKNAVKG